MTTERPSGATDGLPDADPDGPAPYGPAVARNAPRASHPVPRQSTRRIRRRVVGAALVGADTAALVVASALSGISWWMAVGLGVTVLALLAHGRLYHGRAHLSVLDDLPPLLGRVILSGTLLTSLDLLADLDQGRRTLAATALLCLTILLLRGMVYAVVRGARRRGSDARRTLVVGSDAIGVQLSATLRNRPEYGLDPVGYVSPPLLRVGDERASDPLRQGDITELADTANRLAVHTLVIAADSLSEANVDGVLSQSTALECDVFILPRLFELGGVGRRVDLVWGLPLVRVDAHRYGHRPVERRRAADETSAMGSAPSRTSARRSALRPPTRNRPPS